MREVAEDGPDLGPEQERGELSEHLLGEPARLRGCCLALGPLVLPHSYYGPATSHYGLLRTIEDAWGLPRLGRSARTKPIAAIWR